LEVGKKICSITGKGIKTSQLKTYYYHSPIGWIELKSENETLYSLVFVDEDAKNEDDQPDVFFQTCIDQLSAYFNGSLHSFDIPISYAGTAFQIQIWEELRNVAYGEMASYEELSIKVNNPKAIRAVANANAQNKFHLLVPCHRIIGKNGSLTGYAGGIWRKQWLLDHEAKISGKRLSLF
jgi:methylated-DNA-[protein]-cysteine S-methyltransferase